MPTTASIVINSGPAGVADTNLPLNDTVYLSNNDNTGVVSHEWVIVSQPAGDQDDLVPPKFGSPIVSEAAAPEFTPTKEGSYLIKLTVNKGLADESTDTTICAVRELLTGDRIPAPQETTEVNEEYGWATAAVTKILQRVTRLSDAGIFVAQNASAGDLSLGKVVHMNGMATIGTGTNERSIPTVGLALANDVALVDGPLGVVVGDRDGDPYTVADGALCRVMVMGGISSYDLGDTAAAGAPVFVDDLGNLSLTAGTVIRQVGDVAKVVSGTVYDIAISAGANSIPRGNAGGDLDGMYPDPTVAKINGTSVPAAAGAAVGNVLRLTNVTSGTEAAEWGPVDLADTDAVTGVLPVLNGGTGRAIVVNAGGIIYGTISGNFEITAAGTTGYLLKSNGSGSPTWLQTVPVDNGGTGLNSLTSKGVVYAASATTMATTTAGVAGAPLLSQGPASNPVFGALALNGANSVTGTLPVSNGGTGQASNLTNGGVIYASSTSAMASLALPATNGSVLLGNAATAPYWATRLPLASGGTNADLSGAVTNGIVVKSTASTLGTIAPAIGGGVILTSTFLGVPTWKTAGNAGDILTLTNPSPGEYSLDWQSFAEYFDAQYAGSTVSTDATFSTTGGAYTEIVAVTRSCKRGMVQVTPMPIADGAAFINYITTASTNTYTTVKLKYQVTFPDTTIQNYLYEFRSSVAHNNNQNTGSITFPTLTFYTSQENDHTVSLQATVATAGDTFTVNAIALRISQG